MNNSCEIIKDLLPLYVDGVCSDSSKEMVENHLSECMDCRIIERQIRNTNIENMVKEERTAVLDRYAKKERSAAWKAGAVIAGLLFAPIILSTLVILSEGIKGEYGLLSIIISAMLLVASLTAVPLMSKRDRFVRTILGMTASILLLEFFIQMYYRESFADVAVPTLFGLSVPFFPFVVRSSMMPRKLADKKLLTVLVWALFWFFLTLVVVRMPKAVNAPFNEGMVVSAFLMVIVWTVYSAMKLIKADLNTFEKGVIIMSTIVIWLIFFDSCLGVFFNGFKDFVFHPLKVGIWSPDTLFINIALSGITATLFISSVCVIAHIIKNILENK